MTSPYLHCWIKSLTMLPSTKETPMNKTLLLEAINAGAAYGKTLNVG